MENWNNQTPICLTCGRVRCKFFSCNGCINPNVGYCTSGSLYWPWQMDYENMKVLIGKRAEINEREI